MKICKMCLKSKRTNSFYISYRLNGKPIFRPECKQCNKLKSASWNRKNKEKRYNILLKNLYGITLQQYYKILKKQHNKCAICGSKQNNKNKKRFDVDHCHKTGKVRGLLCQLCNSGLGKFRDNKKFLTKAINYLRKNA